MSEPELDVHERTTHWEELQEAVAEAVAEAPEEAFPGVVRFVCEIFVERGSSSTSP